MLAAVRFVASHPLTERMTANASPTAGHSNSSSLVKRMVDEFLIQSHGAESNHPNTL
jgi:hypothetical protein